MNSNNQLVAVPGFSFPEQPPTDKIQRVPPPEEPVSELPES